MQISAIIQPVIVLGLWTSVMCVWMYATRIPAMGKAGISPQGAKHTKNIELPSKVAQIADNYNHLFEQPTLFYATALAIAVMGHADSIHVQAAWAFVILRIVHSLVQTTINVVLVRFTIFILSWLALIVMLVREANKIF